MKPTADKPKQICADIEITVTDDGKGDKPRKPSKFEQSQTRAAKSGCVCIIALLVMCAALLLHLPGMVTAAAAVAFAALLLALWHFDRAIFVSPSSWTPLDDL